MSLNLSIAASSHTASSLSLPLCLSHTHTDTHCRLLHLYTHIMRDIIDNTKVRKKNMVLYRRFFIVLKCFLQSHEKYLYTKYSNRKVYNSLHCSGFSLPHSQCSGSPHRSWMGVRSGLCADQLSSHQTQLTIV